MKKFRIFLIFVLCLCVIFTLTACARIKLATPIGLRVDYDKLTLNWVPVNDATGYEVAVDGEVIDQTQKTSYALRTVSVGVHQLTVRALGDGNVTKTSEWSQPVEFIMDKESGLEFKLINNSTEYMVTGIGTAGSNIVIPDYYRQKPVTKIEKSAFTNQSRIKTVVVGANVKVIEEKAFYSCTFLESIEFMGEQLESLGASAFQSCWKLKQITIPSGVKTIGQYTFNYCRALETVNFNNDLYAIDGHAFSDCDSLTTLTLPDSVVAIGEKAFSNCKELVTVNFGNNLLQIGQYCFAKCAKLQNINFDTEQSKLQVVDSWTFLDCPSLVSVTMPNSLKAFGHEVFKGCTNLEELNLGDNVESMGAYIVYGTKIFEQAEGIVYVGNWIIANKDIEAKTVEIKDGTVGIANQAFDACLSLTTLNLPDSVKYVGAYAFARCQSLVSAQLSPQIKRIEPYTFSECINLRIINLVDTSTEYIGKYAFSYCESLANVELPNKVTQIGLQAFYQTKLWKDSTPGEIVYVGNWAIGFKQALTPNLPETFKDGTIGIADYAFYDQDATYVTIPNSVKYLGEYSFYRSSMKYLKLSSSIEKVGNYAFFQCTDIKDVTIPEGVKEIGRSAFYQIQCTSLSLPQSLKTIGMYAFYRPEQLQTLNLGGVETIGRGAFYNAIKLESLTIPSTVQTIDSYAFYGCELMTQLTFEEGVQQIGEYSFAKAKGLTNLDLPNSLTTIDRYAFRDMANCTNLVLGEGLQTVGEGAFMNCGANPESTTPTYITIKGNNAVFGKYAFRGCSNLKSVIIQNSAKYFDMHAFYGCKKATFFIEKDTDVANWDSRWNSSKVPVLSGITLSEDKTYVESFEKTSSNLVVFIGKVASAPVKEGFDFAGWSTTLGGKVEYQMSQLEEVADGTTLYAVWDPATPTT